MPMATGSATSRLRLRIALAAIVLLMLCAAGYHVGRDMAHRDNARAAIAR